MKVMVSTNPAQGQKILNREFNAITWASDNMETVAHYYEGCVIELDIALDPNLKNEYVSDMDDLQALNLKAKSYTWGSAEMACPMDAIWYSFSADYLMAHVISAREIFPDLSAWNDDDD